MAIGVAWASGVRAWSQRSLGRRHGTFGIKEAA